MTKQVWDRSTIVSAIVGATIPVLLAGLLLWTKLPTDVRANVEFDQKQQTAIETLQKQVAENNTRVSLSEKDSQEILRILNDLKADNAELKAIIGRMDDRLRRVEIQNGKRER